MTLLESQPTTMRRVQAMLPPLLAALAALLLSQVAPLLSPLLVTMVLGAMIVNTRLGRHTWLTSDAATTKLLLRLGVVMIGLRLPVNDVLTIGLPGVAVIVCTLAGTYWLTCRIGAFLDLDQRFVSVLAAGFSVCGADAIATVSDAVRARQRDVALAVALVTIYGTAMIVTLPWLANLIRLSKHETGIWAGASVHEVAQVAVTASIVGGSKARPSSGRPNPLTRHFSKITPLNIQPPMTAMPYRASSVAKKSQRSPSSLLRARRVTTWTSPASRSTWSAS